MIVYIHLSATLCATKMMEESRMLIAIKLIKLAVICAIFFTIYDLIAFGEITWFTRFFGL